MDKRETQIIAQGSKMFTPAIGAITPATLIWYDVASLEPDAQLFEPLDSIVIQNNSAVRIEFYLDTQNDDYTILPFSTQPISRRSFRRFGIRNDDVAVGIAAGAVIIFMRRLPPDVMPTVSVR